MFFAVALANLVLPSHVANVAQLLLLSFSVLIQPLISFFFLETFTQRGVFAVVAIVWKVFDWWSILDLFQRAHVLFTTHNVYYWILNYFHFGLFDPNRVPNFYWIWSFADWRLLDHEHIFHWEYGMFLHTSRIFQPPNRRRWYVANLDNSCTKS